MNKIVFLLGFLCITSLLSCDKDEDTCTTDDWAGTYNGTLTCNGSSDPVAVTITKVDDNTITFDGSNVDVDGCTITQTLSIFGGNTVLTASLSGDKLTYKIVDTDLGVNCSTTLDRQ